MPIINENPTKLEIVRRNAGLTRKQLEEKSGIGFRIIERYEQRARSLNNATYNIVTSLAEALGVDPKEILD